MTTKTNIQVTAATHLTIKLTPNNYPVWKKQVESTLISLDYDGHLISEPPPTMITDKEGKTSTNPDYRTWYRRDQMIFSAMLGSCSEAIQPLISSADTAKEAWTRLKSSYASTSRSRIISLKSKLVKNPRGSRSITEFLQDMRAIADDLALAQSPISEEDLMIHILTQLGDEYNTITAALKVSGTTLSYSELFDKLTDFERNLKDTSASLESVPTTVNYTSRNPGYHNRTNNNSSRPNRPQNASQSRGNSQSQWQTSGTSQWNTNSSGNRNQRQNQFCQYCNIPSHLTKDCRKLSRFLRDNNITSDTSRNTTPTANDLSTGARLMRGERTDGVYHSRPPAKPSINATLKNSPLTLHHKLGHPSRQVFKAIVSKLGLSQKLESDVHCSSCSINKSHKLPFDPNSFVSTKPLQLIYSDVWGPVQQSIDKYTYYVIFVDHFTKYTWLYPMSHKNDVAKLFPQFKLLVEIFFQHPIVSLFSDNGGEYLGLLPYLQSQGISHYTTPPHTPEQNGTAERRHRHIVETGLALLHDSMINHAIF
ncbi:hypothetical protein LXL04_025186 [Taraxacum kok-saghyz]